MADGGAVLALDVVTNNGEASVLELLRPNWVRSDENGEAVNEGTARVDGGLSIEAVRLF